jgi:hypothetical protein
MEKKIEVVKAYNSNLELVDAPRDNVRSIGGEYYISGEGCVEFEGKWNRVNNGKVFFNVDSGEYVSSVDGLRLVCYTFEKGKFLIGFSSKPENSFKLMDLQINNRDDDYYGENPTIVEEYFDIFSPKSLYYIEVICGTAKKTLPSNICITNKVIKKANLVLRPFNHHYFYNFDTDKYEEFINKKIKHNNDNSIYSKKLEYNSDTSPYKDNAIKGFSKFKSSKEYNDLYEFSFKNKSFGVEVETSSGQIPEKEMLELGFMPLRDGSLQGGIEYTSIPFNSGDGIESISKFYELVQKYCLVNDKCSFHIHIGNVERSRLNALTMYKLCYRIQEELFDIVPVYKKELRYWNSKDRSKDHCQSLKSLNLNLRHLDDKGVTEKEIKKEFNKLFKFCSEGADEGPRFNFENKISPKEGASKWNLNSRYFFVNFIPYFFMPQETVEFRIFNSPLNFDDSLNYILISMAIINYCEDNGEKIRSSRHKIQLEDILNHCYPDKLANSIVDFIEDKRNQNFDDYIKDNIYAENERQNCLYPGYKKSTTRSARIRWGAGNGLEAAIGLREIRQNPVTPEEPVPAIEIETEQFNVRDNE